mgnify:FL=1
MISDVFCKIINKELPAEIVMEDDDFIVIKDIHPQAPVHVLIIPKRHLDIIHEASHEDLDVLGKLLIVAGKAAQTLGVAASGYRLILNQGVNAGQLVPHLHMHLLAEKKLGAKIINTH